MSPYAEPAYRMARELLARGDVACVHHGPRCSGVASSPDHVPPLAEHRHEPGSGCCRLVPSCAPCNLARGAAIANRRRRRRSRTRLAPGSGLIR